MKKNYLLPLLLILALSVSACTTSETKDTASQSSNDSGNTTMVDKQTTESFDDLVDKFNAVYKKALFATGQEKADEAESLAPQALALWEDVEEKYLEDQPGEYQKTQNWQEALQEIGELERKSVELVNEGDLLAAHEELEMVRKRIHDLRVENNIQNISGDMLVYHDIMEEIAEAESKDSIEEELPKLKTALDALASYNQDNEEYQSLLASLEEATLALETADAEEFKSVQAKLKPAFIILYLKFG